MPDERVSVGAGDFVAPVLMRMAFHCVHCGVFTSQHWSQLLYRDGPRQPGTRMRRCVCFHCDGESFWLAEHEVMAAAEDPSAPILWPFSSSLAPQAHPDMPPDVRDPYDEARGIVERSPRGACALLRLGLQLLMPHLGEPGKNIDADIQSLVSKGLAVEVQEALDAIRVIGNEAVHPGTLDLQDDVDTAVTLFGIVNFIVDQRISQPKKVAALYAKLPPNKLAGIANRDANRQTKK